MLYDRELRPEHKRTLIKELFKDFDEFVAIILYGDGKELTSVYDTRILETAGIAKTGLSDYFIAHPIPFDQVLMGDVYIANATIKESLPAFVLAISHPAPDKTTDTSVIAAIIRLRWPSAADRTFPGLHHLHCGLPGKSAGPFQLAAGCQTRKDRMGCRDQRT